MAATAAAERQFAALKAATAQAEATLAAAIKRAGEARRAVEMRELNMERMAASWVREHAEDHRGAAPLVPPARPFTAGQITSPPFTAGSVRNWGEWCTRLQAEMVAEVHAVGVRDALLAGKANGTWIVETPELAALRVEAMKTAHEKDNVSALARAADGATVAMRTRVLARAPQLEVHFRSVYGEMAAALVSMGVPLRRLVGLEVYTWRLPSVVSNFADELRDQFHQASVHREAAGSGPRTDGLRCAARRFAWGVGGAITKLITTCSAVLSRSDLYTKIEEANCGVQQALKQLERVKNKLDSSSA